MPDKDSMHFLLSFLIPLTFASETLVKYRRTDWKHWINRDGSCFNIRHEILRDRSLIPPVTGKKKKFCYVASGKWNDYYYPEILERPKDIDIDHIVPLKHAHDLVGNTWSLEMKERFANDPENLAITNKKYNRQKRDKSLSKWLPINIEYACKYYRDWMSIKAKYSLPVSEEEKNAVDLKRCTSLSQ